jgi:hypothetical protein
MLLLPVSHLAAPRTLGQDAPPTDFSPPSDIQPGDMDFDFNTDEFDAFGTEEFNMNQDIDPAAAVFATVIMIASVVLSVLGLLMGIYVAFQLSSALSALPESARDLSPVMPWLMFVPVIGIVFLLLSLIKVPRSLSTYLNARGNSSHGDCGEKLGLWGAILTILGCTAPIGIVMLILAANKVGKAKAAVQLQR